MRLGLFLNFEHDPESPARGSAPLREEIALGVSAEASGFDEVWVSEHHFSPFSQSGASLVLLAHLAALTARVRLGPAAVLLPFHNPLRVAEDLATIDVLSQGRLNVGLARGGPFPEQNEHFGETREDAAKRLVEATEFLSALLEREKVSFHGSTYSAESLTVYPRPEQRALPVWVATSGADAITLAAKRGYGLMAGQAWKPAGIQKNLTLYSEAAGGEVADLVVLRTAFVADTDAEAERIARPAVEHFVKCMRPQFGDAPPPGFTAEAFLDQALIGSPVTCREKLARLCEALPIASLVLKPAALDPARRTECVHRFRAEVLAQNPKLH